jgi:hypothetical protein
MQQRKRATPCEAALPIHRRFKTPAKLFAEKRSLLELDGAAGFFDLLLDLLGFFLVDAFLDRLRRAFDERLGFAELPAAALAVVAAAFGALVGWAGWKAGSRPASVAA